MVKESSKYNPKCQLIEMLTDSMLNQWWFYAKQSQYVTMFGLFSNNIAVYELTQSKPRQN